VSVVAFTYVVTRESPFTWTNEPGTNELPLTVTVVGVAFPTRIEAGLRMICPTVGLVTCNIAALEVPPPGNAFTAVTARVPVADKSDAESITVTWVALVYVVVRAEPFTWIVVVGTKPVPVTVTEEDPPTTVDEGETDVIAGTGLSTSTLLGALLPLVIVPFSTSTVSCAPLVN